MLDVFIFCADGSHLAATQKFDDLNFMQLKMPEKKTEPAFLHVKDGGLVVFLFLRTRSSD